jgi:hypothetical protein
LRWIGRQSVNGNHCGHGRHNPEQSKERDSSGDNGDVMVFQLGPRPFQDILPTSRWNLLGSIRVSAPAFALALVVLRLFRHKSTPFKT